MNIGERSGTNRKSFDLECQVSALPGTNIDERPPIRSTIRQLHIESELSCTAGQQFEMPLGSTIFYRQVKEAFRDRKFTSRIGLQQGLGSTGNGTDGHERDTSGK